MSDQRIDAPRLPVYSDLEGACDCFALRFAPRLRLHTSFLVLLLHSLSPSTPAPLIRGRSGYTVVLLCPPSALPTLLSLLLLASPSPPSPYTFRISHSFVALLLPILLHHPQILPEIFGSDPVIMRAVVYPIPHSRLRDSIFPPLIAHAILRYSPMHPAVS
ncbi:hypothetical protein C8R47DRAFT_1222241 [Mycena vitilis]|nr:hypothetical protein C8R47DRAFT_1222241 [Mycena vitilis]